MSQVRDLDTQTVRCLQCSEMIKFSDRDHWRRCEKHPARAAVEELSIALAGFCEDRPGRPGPCLCYLEERGRKCGYCRCRELLAKHGRPA